MTHELAVGRAGELLTLQSVSRGAIPGLTHPQSGAVLVRLPRGGQGQGAGEGTSAGEARRGTALDPFRVAADPFKLLDPATERGAMSGFGAIPIDCGANGSSAEDAQDWVRLLSHSRGPPPFCIPPRRR